MPWPQPCCCAGDPDDPRTRALVNTAWRHRHPHRILVVGTSSRDTPLLANRHPVEGKPSAWVCGNHTCHPPVTEPADLEKLLAFFPVAKNRDLRNTPG